MQVKITSNSKAGAQVTIDGEDAESVNAAIIMQPNEDQSLMVVTLQCFEDGVAVSSNIEEYTTSFENDPNLEPELLIEQGNTTITQLISKDGYGVQILN